MKKNVKQTRSYRLLHKSSEVMDRYYIDPLLGLIPGGWGDIVSALMVLPFLWFSATVIKSVPLTLAILFNAMKDIVMGLVPFFIGDVLDVFSHSYVRNMRLVEGFVDGDQTVIREVNRKAWGTVGAIVLCVVVIVLLVKLTIALFSTLFS